MALSFTNLLQPNQAVPNLLKNLSPTTGGQTTPQTITPQKPLVPDLGKATTPVKKVTNTDGSSIEYHAPAKVTSGAGTTSQSTSPTTTGTNSTDVNGQLENMKSQLLDIQKKSQLLSGAATPQPIDTSYGGLVNKTASVIGDTSEIDKARQALAAQQGLDIKSIQDIYNQPIPLNFQRGQAQTAQLAQAQKESALATNLSNVIATRGQNISGLTGLAGLSPEILRYGGANGGPMTAEEATQYKAQLQNKADFTQKYEQGKASLTAADAIQNQIISTLATNPTLNNTPISGITNLNELLSGQVSSGPQQLLSQQIAQYIQTLGLDPATVVNIAHQQQGTLAQLLDSLRSSAQAKVEAYNPANINASPSAATGGSTGTGGGAPIFGSFF